MNLNAEMLAAAVPIVLERMALQGVPCTPEQAAGLAAECYSAMAVAGGEPPQAPSLLDIHTGKTGKVSDKWEAYFPVYERLFTPLRAQPISLLEIGVQNGGSLDVWAAYLPQARRIVGCDIEPKCAALRYSDPRISVLIGDATTPDTRDQVLGICPAYDVVIDDGSHLSHDIIAAFLTYFPAVKDGGVFVVEDMHAVYRHVQGGGVLNRVSAQEFFKALSELPNHEHWSNDLDVRTLLAAFFPPGRAFPNWLDTIESIEFRTSMVIIRKGRSGLGRRIVVGDEATVFAGSLRHVKR